MKIFPTVAFSLLTHACLDEFPKPPTETNPAIDASEPAQADGTLAEINDALILIDAGVTSTLDASVDAARDAIAADAAIQDSQLTADAAIPVIDAANLDSGETDAAGPDAQSEADAVRDAAIIDATNLHDAATIDAASPDAVEDAAVDSSSPDFMSPDIEVAPVPSTTQINLVRVVGQNGEINCYINGRQEAITFRGVSEILSPVDIREGVARIACLVTDEGNRATIERLANPAGTPDTCAVTVTQGPLGPDNPINLGGHITILGEVTNGGDIVVQDLQPGGQAEVTHSGGNSRLGHGFVVDVDCR